MTLLSFIDTIREMLRGARHDTPERRRAREEWVVTRRVLTRNGVMEELGNIRHGQPLWPGDTLSHQTARACEQLGLSSRDRYGRHVLTPTGEAILKKHMWTQ